MKYLLIDGNNLAVRNAFANDTLTNSDGIATGGHFGFFNSLISLKKKFLDYQFLVVWDSKSRRRMDESRQAVAKGIIPELYKENRKKDETPKPLKDLYDNMPFLQKGVGVTGIPQVMMEGFEADDVIAAYCKQLKDDNKILIVTSDKDYYQLLDENVSIYDSMKDEMHTVASFREAYGIEPNQFVDVGALCGDSGDNIFGIPGWGEKTAIKEIKQHGSYQRVIEEYEKQHGSLRNKYIDKYVGDVDSNDDHMEFVKLAELKSDPKKENSRIKYPQIYWGMPWSGVLKAFENGEVKIPKSTLMALCFQDRVKIAYSLKKMDDDIEGLPEIVNGEQDKEKLMSYFDYYDIHSLSSSVNIFFDEAEDGETIETDGVKEIVDI